MALETILNKADIHARLLKIIRKSPDTQMNLAKSIGIGEPTLIKFIKTMQGGFKTLCLIEDWVLEKENIHE